MSKLLIVESPAKIKKIAGFLGSGWVVEASRGHVRDLPQHGPGTGIDIANHFAPQYEVPKDKAAVVKRLRELAKRADAIYLATDPDREGESISWHIAELIKGVAKGKPVFRVTFTAITKAAVLTAVAVPRQIDSQLVEAQQARRVIDRLVGWEASPLAIKALNEKSASAGRVQTVCLRLVVDREREVAAFVPQQYWTLDAKLRAPGAEFKARLISVQGVKPDFKQRPQVDQAIRALTGAAFWVQDQQVERKERRPLPPFTTSTLQQAASKALGLSPEKTMAVAQTLYESGYITYMRTDAVAVAPEAQTAARAFIQETYGQKYLPAAAPTYTAKANAQEAHEAIRPVELTLPLDKIQEGVGRDLYQLIWKRFVASQMANAHYSSVTLRIAVGKVVGQAYPVVFEAKGRTLVFDGFLKVYQEALDDGEEAEAEISLPLLGQNQALALVGWEPEEHTTKAPARYTEAALVAALEKRGIGRPSTYATMVKTIKEKGYVRLEKKRL